MHPESIRSRLPNVAIVKCQAFGHAAQLCKQETPAACAMCTSSHLTSEHPCSHCSGCFECTHILIRCVNCNQPDKANSPACQTRAKKLNTLKTSIPATAELQMLRNHMTGIAKVEQLNCGKGKASPYPPIDYINTSTEVVNCTLQERWITDNGQPPS